MHGRTRHSMSIPLKKGSQDFRLYKLRFPKNQGATKLHRKTLKKKAKSRSNLSDESPAAEDSKASWLPSKMFRLP